MKLFNALSCQKTEFKPLNRGEVRLYTCGPTVYDYAHIGNLRTYITEDLLRRSLRLAGYKVTHVMNLTDVDDKTIGRSRSVYPKLNPLRALHQLTRHYEAQFLDDARSLNIDFTASQIVRATDHILPMQNLITEIYTRGWAYVADDGVYFDISKYIADGQTYGQLTNVDFRPQARINNDDYDKQSAADFALWKRALPHEPSWDFELGGQNVNGRPGWHIECSAMSTQHLGQPFDLHTGGIDLAFPHHENEIAQSTVRSSVMATTFLHANHLLVDGTKMSKRLNNFYTLKDITTKGFHPLAFRLRCLQTHYRSELNFTWKSLDAAHNQLLTLYAWADLSHQPHLAKIINKSQAETLVTEIKTFLDNDLDSPRALASLNLATSRPTSPSADLLLDLDQLLGLDFGRRHDITAAQKKLIKSREAARKQQNWVLADRLRAQLAHDHLEVDDTPDGPRWRRIKP